MTAPLYARGDLVRLMDCKGFRVVSCSNDERASAEGNTLWRYCIKSTLTGQTYYDIGEHCLTLDHKPAEIKVTADGMGFWFAEAALDVMVTGRLPSGD